VFETYEESPPTIHRILADRVASVPDRAWLQDLGGPLVTYAEAVERGARWAAALQKLGVGEGAPVSTMMPNSVENTVLWLGLSALRALDTPVHAAYHGRMFEHAVNAVAAETAVMHATFLERLEQSVDALGSLRRVVVVGDAETPSRIGNVDVVHAGDVLADVAPATIVDEPEPWDVAAIIYTSGTTGPSKGVMVPWGQLGCFALRVFPVDDLDDTDRFLLPGVASHIGAKAWPYLTAHLNAGLVLRDGLDVASFVDEIRDNQITTMPLVGALAMFMQMAPPRADDADLALRNVVMAPAIPDLDAFRERFGVRICTAYSMTELNTPFASDGWDISNWKAVGKLKGGYPGVEVRVVDEHDFPVAPGEVGELIVRSAAPWTLNLGYYGMPDATARAWRNGWFHTGDGFTYDEDGYYYFVDRLKDTIRRRGENISSFEVEAMVCEHATVSECAAVAVPSDVTEDEIMIYVVPVAGGTVDPATLVGDLVGRMPRYMVPRYVEVVDELPKTLGTLKAKKAELRARGIGDTTWDRKAAGVELPR
jgi:crotonobetaine/carnitine-CoA ligase